jgi:TatD DNase family protein
MLIDTHAHIYVDEFDRDREAMLSRAQDIGLQRIYMPNIDHRSIDPMLELEQRSPMCVAMMGLHPCSVKKGFEKELYHVETWLAKRPFAAIGEMGTDLYWDKEFWPEQQEAFKIQVAWAQKYQLPLVIHCRESINETLDMLEPLQDGTLTGVFHCFSGNLDQANRMIALGFYLGIGGVATFKNGGLDQLLPQVSLQHLILETDSPYLAPVPHRGKRNEPAYVNLVADRLSLLKSVSREEVDNTTTANAIKLFNDQL